MLQKLHWLRRFLHLSEPRIEHLATLWTVRGPSNRDLTCGAYRVQTGLELRVEYGPRTSLQASCSGAAMRMSALRKKQMSGD
jgi:hypothetical protein